MKKIEVVGFVIPRFVLDSAKRCKKLVFANPDDVRIGEPAYAMLSDGNFIRTSDVQDAVVDKDKMKVYTKHSVYECAM